ncbi:uncharacterized protein EAE97_002867 [Botrytis byssoidea]|uniref:Uncharacterized protein n=1 Tax=Botrytis byssoidea TaxID=139641 RepID=A0A9P5IPC1_9HELO|nr:uncharacterized protein EAE97_002867 [Botrytis byssoidea]KAF7949358.1 hypothetical protein EAE97_002867 [Botrytis byssoidea]
MNDNLFRAMRDFVVIGKGGIRLTSHRELLCDHFKFFRAHRLRRDPLEVPAMTEKMFDSLSLYSQSGSLTRFAVTPLVRNTTHTFRSHTGRERFEEHAQYLRDLYYAVELVDEKPLMNEVMDEIQDLQAAAYSFISPRTIQEIYANTKRFSPLRLYALFSMKNETEKRTEQSYRSPNDMVWFTYAFWAASDGERIDLDEFCPDYEFVGMKWASEVKFDPTIIGSRFGDHGCEFHEHDDPEEIGKCGLLISF